MNIKSKVIKSYENIMNREYKLSKLDSTMLLVNGEETNISLKAVVWNDVKSDVYDLLITETGSPRPSIRRIINEHKKKYQSVN